MTNIFYTAFGEKKIIEHLASDLIPIAHITNEETDLPKYKWRTFVYTHVPGCNQYTITKTKRKNKNILIDNTSNKKNFLLETNDIITIGDEVTNDSYIPNVMTVLTPDKCKQIAELLKDIKSFDWMPKEFNQMFPYANFCSDETSDKMFLRTYQSKAKSRYKDIQVYVNNTSKFYNYEPDTETVSQSYKKIKPHIIIYGECNSNETGIKLEPGQYTLNDLMSKGIQNNSISH